MPKDTPFRDWFDNLDWASIEQLQSERAEESVHREFKRFEKADQFGRKEKKLLAAAIAGFSNAEGGVFLFGPITKDRDGVDGVDDIQLITELSAVENKIKSLIPDATSPAITEAEVKAIYNPSEKNSGVVAVLVPQSDMTPHMAKLGVNQYCRRSSSSTRIMEHSEVADMFGRRPHPTLSISYVDNAVIDPVEKRENTGSNQKYWHYKFSVTIGIMNSGRGAARFPSLELWMLRDSPLSLKHSALQGHNFGLPMRPKGRTVNRYSHIAFGGTIQEAVLPGETLNVVQIDFSYDFMPSSRSQLDRIDHASLGYTIRAEGIKPEVGMIKIAAKELTNTAPGQLASALLHEKLSSEFDFANYFSTLA